MIDEYGWLDESESDAPRAPTVNLSRVQRREIAAIARMLIGHPVHVDQHSDGCSAHYSTPTDEGYSARSVEVYASPGERVYSVTETNSGRDCDGPLTRTSTYSMRKRTGTRKRLYWDHDWSRQTRRV